MIFEGLTQAEVAARDRKLALEAEEAALQDYLASTAWYADRAADYVASSGEYGKLTPIEILAERQAARDRISAIRVEFAAM